MSFLENAKTYTGNSLETIFFRPILSGPSAEELGVRILYNMPLPTTVQMWTGQSNVLQKYTAAGWSGTKGAKKLQKTIDLRRVKAELGFSAADYFSLVYELISNRADVNMDDLSGTELEQAETTLFRKSIAEGIRATMWVGDSAATTGFNTFDGFLKMMKEYTELDLTPSTTYTADDMTDPAKSVTIFDNLWTKSNERVRDLKSEGQLVYFVTSDVYNLYEKYLDSKGVDSAYIDSVNGRPTLSYHGIPVVDIHISSYLATQTVFDKSFCILTDRRNLVLAVNTSDFPGNDIRMWYNPDLMENRQRAVFMAGCDVLDEEMMTYAHKA